MRSINPYFNTTETNDLINILNKTQIKLFKGGDDGTWAVALLFPTDCDEKWVPNNSHNIAKVLRKAGIRCSGSPSIRAKESTGITFYAQQDDIKGFIKKTTNTKLPKAYSDLKDFKSAEAFNFLELMAQAGVSIGNIPFNDLKKENAVRELNHKKSLQILQSSSIYIFYDKGEYKLSFRNKKSEFNKDPNSIIKMLMVEFGLSCTTLRNAQDSLSFVVNIKKSTPLSVNTLGKLFEQNVNVESRIIRVDGKAFYDFMSGRDRAVFCQQATLAVQSKNKRIIAKGEVKTTIPLKSTEVAQLQAGTEQRTIELQNKPNKIGKGIKEEKIQHQLQVTITKGRNKGDMGIGIQHNSTNTMPSRIEEQELLNRNGIPVEGSMRRFHGQGESTLDVHYFQVSEMPNNTRDLVRALHCVSPWGERPESTVVAKDVFYDVIAGKIPRSTAEMYILVLYFNLSRWF